MTTETWKIGDVVVLKSGGTKMTVRSVAGESVNCEWFTEERQIEQGVFHPDTLRSPGS